MQISGTQWSVVEQQIAQSAFDQARQRESEALLQLIKQAAHSVETLEDVWRLNDFLSSKRHEIDGKYDEQPAMLMFALAALIKDGLIDMQELEGLDKDKLSKISALTRM